MQQQRQLNIELLRIFSMLLITLWHVHGHFMGALELEPSVSSTFMNYVSMFISFHVDLFILITGYFGVRNIKSSLTKTLLLLYFYSVLLNITSWGLTSQYNIEAVFLPISHGPWWFMQMYVIMLMIAPVIEHYIKDCSRKNIYITTLVALFINLYFNYFNEVGYIHDGGYGIVNFVCIYILGTWIRKEGVNIIENLHHPRLLLCIAIFVAMAIQYKIMPYCWESMTEYCGPYSTCMSLFIFMLFLTINIPEYFRKVIMFFSSSAIAVYMITDHDKIRDILKPLFNSLYLPCQNNVMGIVVIILCVLIPYMLCCVIDKVRIPITTFIANKILNLSFVSNI